MRSGSGRSRSRIRAAALAVAVAPLLGVGSPACDLPAGDKDRCRDDADCNPGRACAGGVCADRSAFDAEPGADGPAQHDASADAALVAACASADVVTVGDVDGDGRDDILCHVLSAAETRVLSLATDGSRFTARVLQRGFCGPGGELRVGDVNGDGHADLICHEPDLSRTTVAVSQGAGVAAAAPWNPSWCGPARFVVADVDGDGQADTICHETDTLYTSVALSTPPSFTPKGVWLNGFCPPPGTFHVADLDGDGRGDAVCGGGATPYRTAQALADRFATARDILGSTCAGAAFFGDVNGDGKADALCHEATLGKVSAALTTGSALLAARATELAACQSGASVVVGDFWGTKRLGLACVRPSSTTIGLVSWASGAPVATVVGIREP